jgi:hypothetical protein
MVATVQLEIHVDLKGLWRVQVLTLATRLFRCKRLTMALLRSGWCDPWLRVNKQEWQRIVLADEFEWAT